MIVRPASCARKLSLLLLLGAAGCAGGEEARVVVGLTTDMAVGFDVDKLAVKLESGGALVRSEELSYAEGKLSLPAEIAAGAMPEGAEVQVSVDAFGDHGTKHLFTRQAATRAELGRMVLLPVSLGEACVTAICPAGTTCVEGDCRDPFVAPSTLSAYDPSWIATAPDACKTPSSGPPAIVIGRGNDAYAPVSEGEVVPIEAGPQGGYHVWLALRVEGLRQLGTEMTITGYFPDRDVTLSPFTALVTLRKAEGGQCEIHGIRFQVTRAEDVEEVRGQPIEVHVALTDPNGDSAEADARLVIAP
ncbi:MAG: hypothetical protein U0359_12450 [Byssovorax sp.]